MGPVLSLTWKYDTRGHMCQESTGIISGYDICGSFEEVEGHLGEGRTAVESPLQTKETLGVG